jgi:hypothetical protein
MRRSSACIYCHVYQCRAPAGTLPAVKFSTSVAKYRASGMAQSVGGINFAAGNVSQVTTLTRHPDYVKLMSLPFSFFITWAYTPSNQDIISHRIQVGSRGGGDVTDGGGGGVHLHG